MFWLELKLVKDKTKWDNLMGRFNVRPMITDSLVFILFSFKRHQRSDLSIRWHRSSTRPRQQKADFELKQVTNM